MGSSVIKAVERQPPAKGLFRLDLRDISANVASSLAKARSEAEQVVRRARKQAEVELEAAREKGHREGLERGLAEGRKTGRQEALDASTREFASDQESLVRAMTALVEEFRSRREELFLCARRDVVVLAVSIARRLSKRIPRVEGETAGAAIDACKEALALIGKPTEVQIRVHPDDLGVMERYFRQNTADSGRSVVLAAAERAIASASCIRVMGDAAVERGGAIVGTSDCDVDATIDGRVEKIADELEAAWRERASELGFGTKAADGGDGGGNEPRAD